MKTASFKSNFALLDVMAGRRALAKRFEGAKRKKLRVQVEMTIDYVWGGDDGISQEFACTVHSVKEFAR